MKSAPVVSVLWAGCVALALVCCLTPAGWGQDKSRGPAGRKNTKSLRSKPVPNTKSLDQRADSLTSSFVKEADALAEDYFEAGHPDKAVAVLQKVLQLAPNAKEIQQKIDQIQQAKMEANETTLEVDCSAGWEPSGVAVTQGQTVRFAVTGNYRLEVAGQMNAAGLPEKDVTRDIAGGIPVGALMGVIVGADNKPGKPFAIGEGLDLAPRETGRLLLRINAPQGHRSTGKLKVTLGGAFSKG